MMLYIKENLDEAGSQQGSNLLPFPSSIPSSTSTIGVSEKATVSKFVWSHKWTIFFSFKSLLFWDY